ncbi:MAG: cell division protein FtsW [Planctomycetota bacterium]|jgi:cell division protein FtsW
MARFKKRAGEVHSGAEAVAEHQTTIFDRWDNLTKRADNFVATRAEAQSPVQPAVKLFCIILAMMAMGLVLQASHAATVYSDPLEFRKEIFKQASFRVIALCVLLVSYRFGPNRLRALLPFAVVASALMLIACWIPGIAAPKNGSHRWIHIPGTEMTLQASELARVFVVLWVADRCTRLGSRLGDLKYGVTPILGMCAVFFVLIGAETDLGGALVFLAVFLSTWIVGGASKKHSMSLAALGGAGFFVGISSVDYIRKRMDVFFGNSQNDQVSSSIEALGSGQILGNGLGQGQWRTSGMPYQDSDYIFALVGEELGFVGMALCISLILAFLWFSLRLVITIRDRYCALAAFGLLLSVGLQAMLHMQVVTGLAPPKGITLPFISDGGTSLVVSSLAVGLALGAARLSQSTRSL